MTLGAITEQASRNQWIAVGVALGMVACFAGLFYVPDAAEAKAAQKRLDEARADWKFKLLQSQGLPDLREKVGSMVADYQVNLSRIPREAGVAGFLGRVSDLLAEAGIEQREVLPGRPQSKECYVEQPLKITFETPFEAGFRILDRLENLERIIRVEKLEMISLPGEEGKVRMVMRVVIFHSSKTASENGRKQAVQLATGDGKEKV
ncbi:MAG: type 4a pilus biogenesis protein PilO [Anaerolineaceae bacterium]|nr:type 4a pilus biogenesis protein PilO [Anaerolineaceae bacterium]